MKTGNIDPRAVTAVLRRAGAVGPELALSAPSLSERLAVDYGDTGTASGNGAGGNLRRIVAAAVRAGEPIGSCNRGYFVVSTPAAAKSAGAVLRARARALLARAEAIEVAHGIEVVQGALF